MTPGGFKITERPVGGGEGRLHGRGGSHRASTRSGSRSTRWARSGRGRASTGSASRCAAAGGYVRAKYVTAWMMLAPDGRAADVRSEVVLRHPHLRPKRVSSSRPARRADYNEWFPVSVPVDGGAAAARSRSRATSSRSRAPPARRPGRASSTWTTCSSSSAQPTHSLRLLTKGSNLGKVGACRPRPGWCRACSCC